MKIFRFIIPLFLALNFASAQQPKNVQTSQVAATRGQITENLSFGSGKTGSFLSGSALSVAGTLSGTPTGGTLNLSNLTLTLPTTFLTAAQLVAVNASGVNTDGLVEWSQLVGVPAGFADGTDDGGGGGVSDGDKGDVVVSSSGAAWDLDTSGVTAAQYGSANAVPQITFDAKGRATASANVAITSGTGIQKGNGSGGLTAASSGTDYAPATSGTALLKGNGSGGFSNAASGTDYAPATSGSGILKGNGSGGFTTATAGTDYYNPGGTDVALADGGTGASTAGGARVNLQIDNYTAHGNAGASEAFSANTAWHSVTLDQNTAFTVTDWPSSGAARSIVLEILQDGTGSRTIDWSGITSNPPTISSAANSVTVVQLSTRDGGTTVYATSTAEGVTIGSVSGLGSGVATALAVNVGSAGAPVVNGGALGTPSGGTATNLTGLPVSTGISGLGTGIATALAVNTGSAGAPVLLNGALGTPSSGTATNLTGLPIGSGVSGLGTGVATALAVNAGSSGAFLRAADRTVTFVLTVDDLADSLNYDIGFVGAAFTVTEIRGVHFGSGLSSPSIVATVKHGTDRTSGTTIEAVTATSSTTGTSVTSGFDDATVPANSFIWIETGSKSGTTDNFTIIVRGTYD